MKKLLLLTILFALFVSTLLQAQQVHPSPAKRFRPDENSVVTDSSGMRYPYLIWNKMLSSGNYSMKIKVLNDSATYLLVKLTEQEKDAMQARLPQPAESEQFKTGSTFKPFKARAMDGLMIDLKKQMAGKVVVLNFWFIGCPPCRQEIPDLNELVEHYKNEKDVIFVAVALDEYYDIKEFTKTSPYLYHIIDNGRYIASGYGVHLYPTNVVINRESKVVYSSVGYQSANAHWIKKTVDEALKTAANTTAAQ